MDLPIPSLPLNLNLNYWVLQTLAMMLTALLLPRLTISGPFGALATVVALAFVNSFVWDAALFLAIPDHLSIQVLTLFLVNGVIFWILVKILPGIEVQGFLPALVAPVVFTVCSLLISNYLQHIDWIELGKAGIEKVSEFKTQFEGIATTATPTPVSSQ